MNKIDEEIKKRLCDEKINIPKKIEDSIQETLQNLPLRRKTNKKLIAAAAILVLGVALLSISQTPSLAKHIPILHFIQKKLSIGNEYEKVIVEDRRIVKESNGVKISITNTIFDGYQILVSYEVEKKQPFEEKPMIIAPGSLIKNQDIEGFAEFSNEYGDYIDNQQTKYAGVMTFTINQGNLNSANTGFTSNINEIQERDLQGQQINIAKLPSSFDLHLKISKLGGDQSKLQGEWNFDLPIKSEKAKGNVKEVIINKDFSKIGSQVTLEKVIFTPIRMYLQNAMSSENSFMDYIVVDDQQETRKWLGGHIAGYSEGKQRLLSFYENSKTPASITLIPYEYNKTRTASNIAVPLNINDVTKVPIGSDKYISITRVITKNNKTYIYYKSEHPLTHFLPLILIDETGFMYIRNIDESVQAKHNEESVLVYDENLLDKKLTVYSPNTIYYDQAMTIKIK